MDTSRLSRDQHFAQVFKHQIANRGIEIHYSKLPTNGLGTATRRVRSVANISDFDSCRVTTVQQHQRNTDEAESYQRRLRTGILNERASHQHANR